MSGRDCSVMRVHDVSTSAVAHRTGPQVFKTTFRQSSSFSSVTFHCMGLIGLLESAHVLLGQHHVQ
jgi:hypothetical protein